MANYFCTVQKYDCKFVELIIELSSKILWVKINAFLPWEDIDVTWICTKNLLVSSTPSPDQMPGY